MKKRRAPTAADYLSLAAGETVTREVSLGDAYAIFRRGVLRVTYAAVNPSLTEGEPGDALVSNTVSVQLN
jgi:hypothetical protein